MKRIWNYIKPGAVFLAACALLLWGRAFCELSLPGLLGRMADVGVRQGGMEPGLPEAASAKAMELLGYFMPESGLGEMEKVYLTIDPESNEAQRLSERYPLAREERVRVLRDGLSPEEEAAGFAAYRQAAAALLLYLCEVENEGVVELPKEPEKASEQVSSPEESAQPLETEPSQVEFGANLRPSGQEESKADGVIGSVPEGALFQLPGPTPEPEQGEDPSSPSQWDEDTEGQGDFYPQQGLEHLFVREEPSVHELLRDGMDRLYALLPQLEQSSLDDRVQAVENAQAAEAQAADQMSITLKRLFYQELGVDGKIAQGDFLRETGLRALGLSLLAAAAAVLAGLLSARAASTIAERLGRELAGALLPGDAERLQGLIPLGFRALCYAPVLLIGGLCLGAKSLLWTALLAVVLLGGLAAVPLFFEKRFPAQAVKAAGPAMIFVTGAAGLLAVWAGSRAVFGAALELGELIAFLQYAAQAVGAVWLLAAAAVEVCREKALWIRLRSALKAPAEVGKGAAPPFSEVKEESIGKEPAAKPKNLGRSLRNFRAHLKPFQKPVALSLAFGAASAVFPIAVPAVLGSVTDRLAQGLAQRAAGGAFPADLGAAGRRLLPLLAVCLVCAACVYFQRFFLERAFQSLRGGIEERAKGEEKKRLLENADVLEAFLKNGGKSLSWSAAAAGTLLAALVIRWQLGLIALGALALSLVCRRFSPSGLAEAGLGRWPGCGAAGAVGAFLAAGGGLTLGGLQALLQYIWILTCPAPKLSGFSQRLWGAMAAAEGIALFLEREKAEEKLPGPEVPQ